MPETKKRIIAAPMVIVRMLVTPASYWYEDKTKLNLGGAATHGLDRSATILALGTSFVATQSTPTDAPHVVGQLSAVDNPSLSWDGQASCRMLQSPDPRLGVLLGAMPDSSDVFTGGNQTLKEFLGNWRGCAIIVEDAVSGTELYRINWAKTTNESISVQARQVVAKDVQLIHLQPF